MLEATPNRSIDHLEYRTKLGCRKAARADAGMYKIVARNVNGEDAAEVEVIVLGKPSPPEGPLEAPLADRTDKSLKLTWNKPKDDGGAPVEEYIVEVQDLQSGKWTPAVKIKGDKTEAVVEGLTPKQRYHFRVKAINKEGESEPLTTDIPIVAKYAFDEPGKPGKPVIKDYDKDFVELEWKPPENDGGSPIEKYVIEKKVKGSNKWNSVAEVLGDKTVGKVTDVTEREECEFRVVAVNKAGPGNPSDSTGIMTIKPKHLKPRIDRRNLHSITVKEGQSVMFDVGVDGEPPPTKIWLVNDKPINTNRVTIENQDYKTILTIKNASRAESGVWTLKAENDSGKDEAKVEITVLAKPGIPEGPLKVEDVFADSMKLTWKPPVDDGGLPVTYEVEKFDIGEGKWVPCGKTDKLEIKVENLEKGHNYKFRVKAVNNEGSGDYLTTEHETEAKNPFVEPGKPISPVLSDWDKDWAEITWEPPASDGGSPITGYVIEKRDKFGDWEKAAEVTGNKPKGIVKDLRPGDTYQFRIRAVNKGGVSEPSDPTAPHVAKPRKLKPKIDRKSLLPLRIKAGQTVAFDVDVEGEPAPNVTWKLNGKDLSGNDHIKIDNIPYNTKLVTKTSMRSDNGTYTITAINEHGLDEAEVEVTVLSPPSQPKGPLKVADVTKDGCKLSWNPPDDLGGQDLSHYLIEKLDESTGRWTKAGESETPSFQLAGLTEGHNYKFRVKAVNRSGESEPLETNEFVTAKNPFEKTDSPGKPKITDYDKEFVKLTWTPPIETHGAPVEKYIVEKKDKFSGDFVPCAEIPGDTLEGVVSGLIDGMTYEFRVRAVNAAGPSNPSDSTDAFKLKPKNLAPKIDKSNMRDVRIKAGQTYSFEVPVSGEPPPTKTWNLNNTDIVSDGQDHILILTEDYKTTITVKNATREDSGTLTLQAKNASGSDAASVKIIVIDKPTSPNGPLIASDINKSGCHLSWRAPDDDGGCGIDSYVIEKQDFATGKWEKVGESNKTDFDVKGLDANHIYYFRVKAVNRMGESTPLVTVDPIEAKNAFNEPGQTSAPEVTDWDKDHVDLSWDAPRDDGGAKIEKYIIQRREKGQTSWEEGAVVPGDHTEGRCPGLTENGEYEFRILAVNKAGPGKPSDPSRMIKAKARFEVPRMDLDALKDIKIRAGQTIRFNVPISGEPTPTAQWLANGEPCKIDDRTSINATEKAATIEIRKAVRGDKGRYTLLLENSSGKKSGTANVEVIDKPEKPEGPLQIADIHSEGCTLSWKAPLDDGGDTITHYIVEKMDTARGTWAPCGDCATEHLKVGRLQTGKEYKFRVKAVNALGESIPLDAEHSIVAKNPFDVPDAPGQPSIVDVDSDRVQLQWAAPNDNGSPILKYVVEKKRKGRLQFV